MASKEQNVHHITTTRKKEQIRQTKPLHNKRTITVSHTIFLSIEYPDSPYKMIAPLFAEMAEKNIDVKFVKVDAIQNKNES